MVLSIGDKETTKGFCGKALTEWLSWGIPEHFCIPMVSFFFFLAPMFIIERNFNIALTPSSWCL